MTNEKRLIDANLVKSVVKEVMAENDSETLFIKIAESVCNMLDHAPTVDAVEVVRCKDCVNYCGFEHCKNGICDVDSVSKRAVYPDDFCSYGERKDK